MKFEELTVGRLIESGARSVSQAEILDFAGRYDPQWFHVDPQRALRGRWNGLIASGWHTCAIAMELAVGTILKDSGSFGSPGVETIRWIEPVRPGDELRLKVEVLSASRSASGSTGIVNWRWALINQAGRQVLELTTTSLFQVQEAGEQENGS